MVRDAGDSFVPQGNTNELQMGVVPNLDATQVGKNGDPKAIQDAFEGLIESTLDVSLRQI